MGALRYRHTTAGYEGCGACYFACACGKAKTADEKAALAVKASGRWSISMKLLPW
jgi:hypothetical protein